MRRRARIARFVAGGALLAASLVACSLSADHSGHQLTSQGPPSTSTTTPAGLQLVVLGDSLPAGDPAYCDNCTPFTTPYAAHIQSVTGQSVDVHNDAVNGTGTAELLSLLQSNDSVAQDVADGDVIVVLIGHNDMPWVSNHDPCDGPRSNHHANWDAYQPACVAASAHTMARTLDRILSKIKALRAGEPTAYRVVNYYNNIEKNPLVQPRDDVVSKYVVDTYTTLICQTAKQHHMPCVDIYHRFNGPQGTAFDGPYVASDHVHPSTKGHALIARALAESGLQPIG